MKQILHIFKKDTRHFWVEILVSVVVVFLYFLHYPAMWRLNGISARYLNLRQLVIVFMALVPMSWWLLIARLIHAESLVGDREFWLTRPYEWKKLLAAKILFVAVWVWIPFSLGQVWLLSLAAFHPLSYIPGLLMGMVFVGAVFTFPLFVLAAVTANFARMTMTILGSTVLVAVVIFTFNYYSTPDSSSNPYHDPFLFPLLLCGCAAVVVLQYATRRVWIARTLLLLVPLAAAGLGSAYNRNSLVDRAYARPSAGSVAPVLVSFGGDNRRITTSRGQDGDDYLDIPIQYSGIAEGYAIFTDNYKVTLTAADGQQWASPWRTDWDRTLSGGYRSTVSIQISPAVFERFHSAPVTLQVSFAVTRLQAEPVITAAFPDRDTAIPGIGFCAPGARTGDREWGSLVCRSPIRQPQIAYLTAEWRNTLCSEPLPTPNEVSRGGAWIGMVDPKTLDVGMSSVVAPIFALFNGRRSNRSNDDHICSGTPLTVTQYHVVDRTQIDLTIPNLQIPAIKFRN